MNRGELFVALSQDAFVNEITNPFFQARLLRIYHKVKAGCRMFLGNLSLEDFLSAYDELELLLKIGHTVGKNADTTLSVEAAELHWCNFLTLQNLFEKQNGNHF
ncbi:MAG: hypothetical protein EOO61_17695 [Hymenobacter sp.]|nr:MAG: hypothetical protein EOO61_17695 [Hymenobacter sp.]